MRKRLSQIRCFVCCHNLKSPAGQISETLSTLPPYLLKNAGTNLNAQPVSTLVVPVPQGAIFQDVCVTRVNKLWTVDIVEKE